MKWGGLVWRWVLNSGAVVVALTGLAVTGAWADDAPRGQMIARANACMGCHAVDRKVVGPSFQQIAAKYKGDVRRSTGGSVTRKRGIEEVRCGG